MSLAVFDSIPVHIRISAYDAHLVLAFAFQVRFANRLIERSIDWRWRTDRTDQIAPGFLDLADGHIFTAYVAIDGSLIRRVAEFHYDVVNAVCKFWRGHQRTKPCVFLFAAMNFAEQHDVVGLKGAQYGGGCIPGLGLP